MDEDRWSIQYLGPATYVQVRGLRPGRRYAVRVSCRPVVSDDSVVVQLAPPSEVLVVDTPATPPDAPPAPVLATRLKNTLKVRGRGGGRGSRVERGKSAGGAAWSDPTPSMEPGDWLLNDMGVLQCSHASRGTWCRMHMLPLQMLPL